MRAPRLALAVWVLLAGVAAACSALAASEACGKGTVCIAPVPATAAAGTECEGRTVQAFWRVNGPMAVQCTAPDQPDGHLVLVFDPRQPRAAMVLYEGGRVVRSLRGLASQGVPDRFASHPLCPASRRVARIRPDVRPPARLVVLTKVPAEPYCFELRVAKLSSRGVTLGLPGAPAEPPLSAQAAAVWHPLVDEAAALARAGGR